MQKIFLKRISIVMAIFTVILISSVFYGLKSRSISNMYATSALKMDHLHHILTTNSADIETLTGAIREDYINRAESVAYMLSKDPDMLNEELQYIARYVDIDEINVFDENGIITLSTYTDNIGLSVKDRKQLGFFESILENPTLKLVYDILPSSIDGKLIQYSGVTRRYERGIVEIGMNPNRILVVVNQNCNTSV